MDKVLDVGKGIPYYSDDKQQYMENAFLSRNVGLAPKIMRKGIEASFFMEASLNPQSLGSGNAVARGNSRYHE